MEKDTCKLQVGKYQMHFNGYQPESRGAEQFCEDIPSTGPTVIVLDFVDDELRGLPIDVRVVRGGGEEGHSEHALEFHLPPRVYPAGSLTISHDFRESGRYVGLVSAGTGSREVARFPFVVGSTWRHWLKPAAGILALLAAIAAWLVFGPHKHKRRAADHPVDGGDRRHASLSGEPQRPAGPDWAKGA